MTTEPEQLVRPGDRDEGLGPGQPAAAPPARGVAVQQAGALRAHHRVRGPVLARRHPGLVRPAGGGPGDQRVVGVGDRGRAGQLGTKITPQARDPPGLVRPVELVTADVEQYDRARLDLPGHLGQPDLVHLERGSRVVGRFGQSCQHARRHVGATAVAADRAERAQRAGQQPGGRGLAVGPADAGDHLPGHDLGQDPRGDP